jgi:hypothetical protein
MPPIPLGPWAPDLPAHLNPGLTVCKNVIPASGGFYAPVPELQRIATGSTVDSSPKGAFTGRDASNNVTVFVGHGTALKSVTAASGYSDVTRLSGPYQSVDTFGNWRFTQVGNRVIATNFLDDVQTFLLGSSSNFSLLSAGAPRAKFCAVWSPGFLVLGHLDTDSQGVRWGGIGDPTSFPTLGSSAAKEAQSDEQIIQGEHGGVSGVTGAVQNADGLIFMERALYRAQYVGPGPVFSIKPIEGARGTPIPNSIIWYGGGAAFWGGDGFYITDGASTVPIGDGKVDAFFSTDLNGDRLDLMSATYDPKRKLFLWNYPTLLNNQGFRTLVYNWVEKRWTLWDIDDGAADVPLWLFTSSTLGYTVDTADQSGQQIETTVYSPDDPFWAGGPPILAAFYNRTFPSSFTGELATFSGIERYDATFETGEMDLGDGRRVTVRGIRPFTDATSSLVFCSVGHRTAMSSAVSYTTASLAAADGECKQRINTRFARAKIEIDGSASWTKAWAYEANFVPAGLR